jgi:hypothetical protein
VHWPAVLQVCPEAQEPHETVPPHPLEAEPHCRPPQAEVLGVQVHWPAVLQVCPEAQEPHETVPPHPLEAEPHCRPPQAEVLGVQVPVTVNLSRLMQLALEVSALYATVLLPALSVTVSVSSAQAFQLDVPLQVIVLIFESFT